MNKKQQTINPEAAVEMVKKNARPADKCYRDSIRTYSSV